MRFFIVFWMLFTLAFAVEGRGLETKPATAPSAPTIESNSTGTNEVRKADLWKGPVNPDFKVTKIHEVNTDKNVDSRGNKALDFEQKYWMYGAVTEEQIREKKGHIFVISWANKGMPQNIEAKFEYRQAKTKDILRTFTLRHPNAEGANRSQFSVLGKAYQEGGPVQSWRFTLWSGDQLVAESKSFVW